MSESTLCRRCGQLVEETTEQVVFEPCDVAGCGSRSHGYRRTVRTCACAVVTERVCLCGRCCSDDAAACEVAEAHRRARWE